MRKAIDMTGQRFGRLLVISRGENTKQKQAQWHCVCDCGCHTLVRGHSLRIGMTKSCGCLKRETVKLGQVPTHGASNTPLYFRWQNMKKRATDKNRKDYKHYGGRGIAICDEWIDNFDSFSNWALANGFSEDREHVKISDIRQAN